MKPHRIDSVLFSAEQLSKRVDELVDQIALSVPQGNLVVVGILRGSFIFLADLMRALDRHKLHPRLDFTTLQSYGSGTTSSGNVSVLKDICVPVEGADVVLVDDILDTGRTLKFAVAHMKNKGAKTIHTCCLLDKPSRRVEAITADFVGFEVPDTFVVGYGLDYDSYYRELPYIGQVVLED